MKLSEYRSLKVGDKVRYAMWNNLTFKGADKGKIILADRSGSERGICKPDFLLEGKLEESE